MLPHKAGTRRKLGIATVTVALAVGTLASLSPSAGADTVNVTGSCSSNLGPAPITLPLGVDGPSSLPDASSPFSVTFGGWDLVFLSSFSGFVVSSYSNIALTETVSGGTFVSGSLTEGSPPPTIDGSPVTETATITSPNQVTFTVSGPIPPGTLLTPSWVAQVQPDSSASSVVFSGTQFVERITFAALPIANINCNLASTVILTVTITSASTTASTEESTTSTSSSTTTTTTIAPDCQPGWGYGDSRHCHSGPPGQN